MAELANRTALDIDHFCPDQLWNTSQLLHSSWPRLTSCFQHTVLVYVPFALLWLPLPFDLYAKVRSQATPLPLSGLSVVKMFMSVAMSILSLAVILNDVSSDVQGEDVAPSKYLAYIIRTISYLTLALLVYLDRRRHVTTSVIQFVTWAALVICDVVPLYTHVMLKEEKTFLQFLVCLVTCAMQVCQLVLSFISDTFEEEEFDERTSPEVKASYPFKLFFWWIFRTVFTGWRRDLSETDLFNLHPRDTCDAQNAKFQAEWTKEVKSFRSKRAKMKQRPTNEKTPLIGPSNNLTNENDDISSQQTPNSAYWQEGIDRNAEASRPSLLLVLIRMVWQRLLVGFLQKLGADAFLLSSPILISLLIQHADSPPDSPSSQWLGYVLAALLFTSQVIKSVLYNSNFWYTQTVGLQLKTTLISAIYRKSLTMNNEAKKTSTAGEIVNLMSVDSQRIMEVMYQIFFAFTTPIQIGVIVTVLYQYLGASTFAGLLVLILTIPFNSYIATRQQALQRSNLQQKDARLRLTNEALSGMKVLKVYAWEPPFQEKISDIRNEETKVLLRINYLQAVSNICFMAAPYLVTLATFAVYVHTGDDHVLTPSKCFVALSYYNIIRVPLTLLSATLSLIVQAQVSLDRINRFLCTGDLDLNNVKRDNSAENAIEVRNGTFTWDKSLQPILRNIQLKVAVGKLQAVVGPVGSGKSSLVSAILGEMGRTGGEVIVKSRVAFVPQQAWIQNATVRDNILFGRAFNLKKYNKVLKACALQRDLEILAAGDMTEIGEKGINLSGGQKQRVSLARAVYSEADIYLFDDPLSAVDSHVGKHIFDRVIGRGGMLRSKTRLLVTHGAHWLPHVDSVCVMTSGRISEEGSYDDLMSRGGDFAEFIKTYLVQAEDLTVMAAEDPDVQALKAKVWTDFEHSGRSDIYSSLELSGQARRPSIEQVTRQRRARTVTQHSLMDTSIAASVIKQSQAVLFEEDCAGKLVQAELVESGDVKWGVFKTYIKAAGVKRFCLSMLLFLVFQAFSAWSNFWLTDWTEDQVLLNATIARTDRVDELQDRYIFIFALFGAAQILFLCVHNLLYWTCMWLAARRLHLDILASVLRSPMAFFDTTPLGRIMNRFSRDVEVVDNMLPIVARDYFNCLLNVVVTLIVISINTPLFLIMAVPIFGVYLMIQKFYIPTSRQLKRLESVTRSPIYNHFSETLSGGATIRAFDATEHFQAEARSRVDRNQALVYTCMASNRWLGINLEILANFVILGAALFSMLTPGVSGALVGLSLSYAVQVSSNLNWMVRMKSEMESNLVSVERICEYSNLTPEAPWTIPDNRPKADWPQLGCVKFESYMTRYRPGLELVLRGMSCEFKAGEKIGIVGRTGAGKSSLALALFRLIEAASGSITVDEVDIGNIGLHDVRSRLTILPQEPVLFVGTLRMNLDPMGRYSDDQLWSALNSAHLKSFVVSTGEGLDYQVGEEGQSLSVGQRQLVCLARALLKKSRVLILDEATAAVDMETDDLIQKTIRQDFRGSTVISIAHRINTIMDYDQIMVLDCGEIKEMDTPTRLLADTESAFYSLAKEANLV